MRYISKYTDMRLYKENGAIAYEWDNGVFTIGDPTTNATPGTDAIDPNLAATDGTALQTLYPAAGTAIGKVGLGQIFFEAPPLTNATALSANTYYEVVEGTVTYEGASLARGTRFKTTATTAFTGSGKVALALAPEHFQLDELNERAESFRKNNLAYGDEATWDDQNLEPTETAFTFVR